MESENMDCMENPKGRFHKRFNAARKDMYLQDWEPDKAYTVQGKMVPYVSIAKMKRNIAPVLLKNGIDFSIEFSDLKMQALPNGNATYWSVECAITFYDEETGYSETSRSIGGYAGTDKGINICQTFALKQALGSLFLLIDGIEAEMEDDATSSTYHKKTAAEVEEVKSAILENKNVITPDEKKETPKSEPKEKAKAGANIKAVDEETIAPKNEGKKEVAATSEKFVIPDAQKNTVAKILENWEVAAKEGRTTVENYNNMSMDYATFTNVKDVIAFIRKYKVVF